MRLPRFMEERQMTGAQIGTAFHRMMRMLDLDALRATHQLEAEIARQRERLLADGIVSENELAARQAISARAAVCLAAGRAYARRHKSCTANGRLLTAARRRRARSSCRA